MAVLLCRRKHIKSKAAFFVCLVVQIVAQQTSIVNNLFLKCTYKKLEKHFLFRATSGWLVLYKPFKIC